MSQDLWPYLNLTLPFPDADLSPNKRLHWSKKIKKQSEAKRIAFVLANAAKIASVPSGKIPVRLVFHKKKQVRYDLDNALASMKYALDGVALAIGVDDTVFRPITIDEGGRRDDTVDVQLLV